MNRISVIGISGAGKSTLARKLASALHVPVLELDGVYHQAGWRPLPNDAFRARVGEFIRSERWIVDGNYTSHGITEIVWSAADTVIWLDPPRNIVMRQVIGRTMRRLITGEELWNGNRESVRGVLDPRPEENVVLWAWTRYTPTRDRYEALLRAPEWAHLGVIRLRSPGDVERFLATEFA